LKSSALGMMQECAQTIQRAEEGHHQKCDHSHGKNVEYHAKLLQNARTYKHSLAATSAIKAAIRALTSELTTGHNHDKNALKKAKTAGNTAIVTANNKGTTTCAGYRKSQASKKWVFPGAMDVSAIVVSVLVTTSAMHGAASCSWAVGLYCISLYVWYQGDLGIILPTQEHNH